MIGSVRTCNTHVGCTQRVRGLSGIVSIIKIITIKSQQLTNVYISKAEVPEQGCPSCNVSGCS